MHPTGALRGKLSQLCFQINRGDINSSNVTTLFGLLREKADKNSWTLDIGDLFAHPEKDRGLLKNSIKNTVEDYLLNGQNSFKPSAPLPYQSVLDDLNKHLKSYHLAIYERVSMQFCLVLFNALTGAQIKYDKITLYIGFKSIAYDKIFLIGILKLEAEANYTAFPIFAIPNKFGIPDYESHPPETVNAALLQITIEAGNLDYWQEFPQTTAIPAPKGETIEQTIERLKKLEKENFSVRSGIEARAPILPPG